MKVFKCKEKHSNNYSKELYWSSPKSKILELLFNPVTKGW